MRIGLLIFLVLSAIAVAACSDPTKDAKAAELADDFSDIPGGKQGSTQVDTASLATLGTQIGLGTPFTVDASKLIGPFGERPLAGEATITFEGIEGVNTVSPEGRALAGGTGATFYDSREGTFLVVYYTVENNTEGRLQPVTHVNNMFKAVDAQGRQWEPATFATHAFSVAFALGFSSGKDDPRVQLEPGASATVGIAFDVALDTTGVKLRSEILDVEVSVPDSAPAP